MNWFIEIASWIAGVAVATSPLWIWLLSRWIHRRIEAGVDHRFAERLASHKHELSMIEEAARFDYQRRLHDFELFVSKKHEVYARLWELVRRAEGAVLGLFGFRREAKFEEMNAADVKEYLKLADFPVGKQKEILAGWESNRSEAAKALREVKRLLEVEKSRLARQEVVNYLLANELYFSDSVAALTEEYVDQLHDKISRADYPEIARSQPEKYSNDDVRETIKNLKRVMRREVSVGYYREESEGEANGG